MLIRVFLSFVHERISRKVTREKASAIEFSRYAVTRNVYELPLAGMHLHARHGACSDIPDNDERDANDRCIFVKGCSLSRNVYSGLNRIQSFAVVERFDGAEQSETCWLTDSNYPF